MADGKLFAATFSAAASLIGACGVGGYYALVALARLVRATLTAWGV